LGFLSFYKKNQCELCHNSFHKQEHLIKHVKEEHHKPILKCQNCGMQFLHEKERLHHMQDEKKKKIDLRRHKL
jgi:transcription elongation factor Elf1